MSKKKFFIISLCVIIPIVAAVIVICIYPYISKKNEPSTSEVVPTAPENILWEPSLLTSTTSLDGDYNLSFSKPYQVTFGEYYFRVHGSAGKINVGPYVSQDYLFSFKDSVSLFTVIDFNNEYFARFYSVSMTVTTCDSVGENKKETEVTLSGSIFEGFSGTLNAKGTGWNYVYSVLTTFTFI